MMKTVIENRVSCIVHIGLITDVSATGGKLPHKVGKFK